MHIPASREKTLETISILALASIVLGIWFEWPPWHIAAGVLLFIGAFFKRAAGAVASAWMKLAHILGFINTRLILILIFYLALTPLAVLYRVLHGDFLNLRGRRAGTSLWHVRDHTFTARDLDKMW